MSRRNMGVVFAIEGASRLRRFLFPFQIEHLGVGAPMIDALVTRQEAVSLLSGIERQHTIQRASGTRCCTVILAPSESFGSCGTACGGVRGLLNRSEKCREWEPIWQGRSREEVGNRNPGGRLWLAPCLPGRGNPGIYWVVSYRSCELLQLDKNSVVGERFGAHKWQRSGRFVQLKGDGAIEMEPKMEQGYARQAVVSGDPGWRSWMDAR
jgi:hypothetical protein